MDKAEIALNLFNMGLDKEDIKKATRLSEIEIKMLIDLSNHYKKNRAQIMQAIIIENGKLSML